MTNGIEKRTCKVCKHVWWPRKAIAPKRCPKCNSSRWDIGEYTKEARSKTLKEYWKGKKATEEVISLE